MSFDNYKKYESTGALGIFRIKLAGDEVPGDYIASRINSLPSEVVQIQIGKGIVKGDIKLENIKNKTLEISFIECNISGRFSISSKDLCKLKFSDCEINHFFTIGLNLKQLHFSKSIIFNGILCGNVVAESVLIENNCIVYPMDKEYNTHAWSFSLRGNNKIGHLEINNSTFGSIELNNQQSKDKDDSKTEESSAIFDNITFNNVKLCHEYLSENFPDYFKQRSIVIIGNIESQNVAISNQCLLDSLSINKSVKIESLKIKDVNNSDTQLSIELPNIKNLTITDSDLGSISLIKHTSGGFLGILKGLKVSNLIFDQFENNNRLVLQDISRLRSSSESSTLHFYLSHMGNTKFIGCDFDLKWNVEIRDSKIFSCDLNRTKFPKKLKNYLVLRKPHESELKNLAETETIREFINQLSRLYAINNDNSNALTYKAHSLRLLQKSLGYQLIESLKYSSTSRFTGKDFGDYIALSLNCLTNYFGDKVLRAFITTALLVIISFSFYCRSLGFKWDFTERGYQTFYKLCGIGFEFINPLHDTDFLTKELNMELTSNARIIDGIARLFIAYFVYQFIQAFRKLGAKGNDIK